MENDNSTGTLNFQYVAGHSSENENDEIANTSASIVSSSAITMAATTEIIGSQVWAHFTKDISFKVNKKAVCNYCKATYVCSGSSTSNLMKHLNKNHITKLNLSSKKTNLDNFFSSTKVSKVYYCFKFKIYLYYFYI